MSGAPGESVNGAGVLDVESGVVANLATVEAIEAVAALDAVGVLADVTAAEEVAVGVESGAVDEPGTAEERTVAGTLRERQLAAIALREERRAALARARAEDAKLVAARTAEMRQELGETGADSRAETKLMTQRSERRLALLAEGRLHPVSILGEEEAAAAIGFLEVEAIDKHRYATVFNSQPTPESTTSAPVTSRPLLRNAFPKRKQVATETPAKPEQATSVEGLQRGYVIGTVADRHFVEGDRFPMLVILTTAGEVGIVGSELSKDGTQLVARTDLPITLLPVNDAYEVTVDIHLGRYLEVQRDVPLAGETADGDQPTLVFGSYFEAAPEDPVDFFVQELHDRFRQARPASNGHRSSNGRAAALVA